MKTAAAIKKLTALLLVLATVPFFFSCGGKSTGGSTEKSAAKSSGTGIEVSGAETQSETSKAAVQGACTPIMFRVTGESGGVLYLFGSIHAGDGRMADMPDYVLNAYEESDYICVETDIVAFEKDTAEQIRCLKLMLCSGGTEIKDHIGEKLYKKARTFLKEHNLYMKTYDGYAPAFWNSLLEEAIMGMTKLSYDYGADRFFLNKAHGDGKEVRVVESAEFQYRLLASFSDELYRLLIESAVDGAEENAELLTSMYEAWLRGDETELRAMIDAEPEGAAEDELKLYAEYNKALLTDRNIGMAEKARQYLAEGKNGMFIVGEAHILGEGGLVDTLRGQGFNVERVTETQSREGAASCCLCRTLAA